ncbi:MAG: hypothetical protein GX542_06350 [Rhodococcus sp.]|nr:hypothetical protein [Rhodococcus sp. (in: high G+C Gram-positive bacteria)]
MTAEEGTISGALDVSLDYGGRGWVRYRGTGTWLQISNLDDEPPTTWGSVDELVEAIESSVGQRDIAGNLMAFEA